MAPLKIVKQTTGPGVSMYGSMEESTPAAEAPALGPAEVKFVRKLMATSTGDDARPAGLLHG